MIGIHLIEIEEEITSEYNLYEMIFDSESANDSINISCLLMTFDSMMIEGRKEKQTRMEEVFVMSFRRSVEDRVVVLDKFEEYHRE